MPLMEDAREPTAHEADESGAIGLLHLAGTRAEVPAERAARVRAAVRTGWQGNLRRRTRRRRFTFAILAAVVFAPALARFYKGDRTVILPGEPVAVVDQIAGSPQRVFETEEGSNTGSLSRSDTIRTGEWIKTDADARVALRFSNGTSLRLDVGSVTRLLSSSVIELSAGAVYVDTESESGRLEVRTTFGTARDVGTQFEVRLLDQGVRLRVRTGSVELNDGIRSVSGRGGTEITLSSSGAVSRPITAHGIEWDWTARVSPPLDTEGLSVAAFLERVAREHGWTLRYDDPALARDASAAILHGSVAGLSPHEMVEVAINSSGLHHRFESGHLYVLRGARVREGGSADAR